VFKFPKAIIEDFKKAINRSNGSNSFYSEGIKIRETIKEAEKRNIDLIGEYTNSFVGYPGKGKDRLNLTLEAFNIKILKKKNHSFWSGFPYFILKHCYNLPVST
jgi:hypothetical protein